MDAAAGGEALAGLLGYIREHRGIDFTEHRSTGLNRRLRRRMRAAGRPDLREYRRYLQSAPGEMDELLSTLFVNVTGFFRDAEAWRAVRREVLPKLVRRAAERPVRIWCAGVATGEEAYSAAILLAEHLGGGNCRERVTILATDVDEASLAVARRGKYADDRIAGLDVDLRDRYFERVSGGWSFRREFRDSLVFGRHDVIEEAPVSDLDLLICRNTLMYFDRSAQNRTLARFHGALRGGGHLLVGTAESILTRRPLYGAVDERAGLFRRIPSPTPQDRSAVLAEMDGESIRATSADCATMRELPFHDIPVPQIVTGRDGRILFANMAAAETMGPAGVGVGRSLAELPAASSPGRLDELVATVCRSGDARVVGAEYGAKRRRLCEIRIVPIGDPGEPAAGAALTFDDLSQTARLRSELARSYEAVRKAGIASGPDGVPGPLRPPGPRMRDHFQ